jgi:hypothetical protein
MRKTTVLLIIEIIALILYGYTRFDTIVIEVNQLAAPLLPVRRPPQTQPTENNSATEAIIGGQYKISRTIVGGGWQNLSAGHVFTLAENQSILQVLFKPKLSDTFLAATSPNTVYVFLKKGADLVREKMYTGTGLDIRDKMNDLPLVYRFTRDNLGTYVLSINKFDGILTDANLATGTPSQQVLIPFEVTLEKFQPVLIEYSLGSANNGMLPRNRDQLISRVRLTEGKEFVLAHDQEKMTIGFTEEIPPEKRRPLRLDIQEKGNSDVIANLNIPIHTSPNVLWFTGGVGEYIIESTYTTTEYQPVGYQDNSGGQASWNDVNRRVIPISKRIGFKIVQPLSTTTTKPGTTELKVGNTIIVVSEPLNVRSEPLTDSSKLGSQPVGTTGIIIDGPVEADGYKWWQINYGDGPDGWSIDENLQLLNTRIEALPSLYQGL